MRQGVLWPQVIRQHLVVVIAALRRRPTRATGERDTGVAQNGAEGGAGGWHKASGLGCLPLAAPIGLSPLLILTLCGPECVLVVSTEPPDDLSCLTTPGVGCRGDGLLPVPRWGQRGSWDTERGKVRSMNRGICAHHRTPCPVHQPVILCADRDRDLPRAQREVSSSSQETPSSTRTP